MDWGIIRCYSFVKVIYYVIMIILFFAELSMNCSSGLCSTAIVVVWMVLTMLFLTLEAYFTFIIYCCYQTMRRDDLEIM
jgi:hypothetical protein